MRSTCRVSAIALLLTASCRAGFTPYNASDTVTTPVYSDLIEFFPNVSNVVDVSKALALGGLAKPNMTDSATVSGFDWTQPWPGDSIDGHGAHLRISFDVSLPEDVVEDATTNVAALTFPVPEKLSGAAMDASWYICRHFFIGTPTLEAPDHTCSFLGTQCLADLKSNLTEGWMVTDDSTFCSGLAFDPIPSSCIDTFGFARMDVIAFDQSVLADATQAAIVASDDLVQYDYLVGTGFHDLGSTSAYQAAANRTYLIIDVWGYSDSVDEADRKTPEASIMCLTPVLEEGSCLANCSSTPTPGTTTSAASSTTSVIKATTSSVTEVTAPAPTQSGIVANCNKWYVAVSGDGCYAIATANSITLDQFYAWNPAVGTDCSGLWANEAYCVGVATISTSTPTATSTSIATSTSSAPSTVTSTTTAPSPNQAGNAISTCNKFAQAVSGDSCYGFTQTYGITTTQLYSWNSVLGTDGSGCSSEFWAGYWYCVGVSS